MLQLNRIQYNIFERAEMGLFFQEKESEYSLQGTEHWQRKADRESKSWIKGCFSERTAHGRIVSMEFNCNDECIFFMQNGQNKSLDLCLTVMQERFSFLNHQRIYEIKLKRKNLITIIFTTELENFCLFYTHLAKYCVLRNFEKHFRLTTPLGTGSFSRVFNGLNIFSKEQVALKVFDKEEIKKISDGEAIIRNQISNLQKLRKFHLSPLIETYETNDCVVIVMQKAEAGNMFDFLKEHENDYNEVLIKGMTLRVLENLDQLHSAGFIHRDIKPENILFKSHSSKSSLFFGDFGLTVEKQQCRWTKVGRMCSGTMGFIAPEVLHENSYDQKCDLFSLGCLFYFLHKGESIFKDRNQEQIKQMTLDNRIIQRKIYSLNNLSPDSQDLMLKLLKIDPKERISAKQALEHKYFARMEHQRPMTGEDDHTLRQYLLNRIDHFFN